jgi:hypothetical protein
MGESGRRLELDEMPQTRDREFDKLLDAAARKYLDPDPDVRQEALKKLWDAFERAKTMLHSNKKSGVAKLVAAATKGASPEEAELLKSRDESPNGHRKSVSASAITRPRRSTKRAFVDQLFRRMYACLLRVHPALR